MKTVSKFTDKDLEKLQAEAELKVYKAFQSGVSTTGLPALTETEEREFLLGRQKCSPKIWSFFENSPTGIQQQLFTQAVFSGILSESEIDRYELVCNNLEPYFSGYRDGVSPREKMAYKKFVSYKELSIEAMRYFLGHFARHDYLSFGGDTYAQWFTSVSLGLDRNPDDCLVGVNNLNYPDLNPIQEEQDEIWGPKTTFLVSPRLKALQAYLEVIYELRIKVRLFDLLIRLRPKSGTSPNVSTGQWEKFVNSTKARLVKKFGQKKGRYYFQKMFGSENLSVPSNQQEFHTIQNEILDKISEAILQEQLGQEWEPEEPTDPFQRNYAKEQQEREAREKANRERKERENQNWANINPQFKNNPNLVKQWTDQGFTYEQTKEWIDIGLKPNDANFATWLRNVKKVDADWVLNEGDDEKLRKEFQEWVKNSKNKDIPDDKPKPTEQPKKQKRSKSPSRQVAEDKRNQTTCWNWF